MKIGQAVIEAAIIIVAIVLCVTVFHQTSTYGITQAPHLPIYDSQTSEPLNSIAESQAAAAAQ